MMQYIDFEIQIDGEGPDYSISVIRSPVGETRTSTRFPLSELELENRVKDLQIALLQSGTTRRRIQSPQHQKVEDFGRDLFNFLFSGEVLSLYRSSLRDADQQGYGLRIKLRFSAPHLAAMPWEFLYDSTKADYVVLSTNTPIVRYLDVSQPSEPLSVESPLRILCMAASPKDMQQLNVELERQRIDRALSHLVAEGMVEVIWLESETIDDLHRAMRNGPWHVFHFVGHGGFDERRDEGLLMMSDSAGKATPITATQLGRILANHDPLRLVFLNACEGAAGGTLDIYSSTASILVRRGLPAVVAMQYEITDKGAIKLVSTFYEALAEGLPVDTALTQARVAISLGLDTSVEWGTPVLHMRSMSGSLFSVQERKSSAKEFHEAVESEANPSAESGQRTPNFLWRNIFLGAGVLAILILITWAGFRLLFQDPIEYPVLQSPVSSTLDPLVTSSSTDVEDPVFTLLLNDADFVEVPGGVYFIGNTEEELESALKECVQFSSSGQCNLDQEFSHQDVLVDTFWIMRTEVSNSQFKQFIDGGGYLTNDWWSSAGWAWLQGLSDPGRKIPSGEFTQPDHPVVEVSWYEAEAYANWLSQKSGREVRLPTEQEWEIACGVGEFIYPWGAEWKPRYANAAELEASGLHEGDGIRWTSAVDGFAIGEGPYGTLNMSGNVWEWTSSHYKTEDQRTFRGGSYLQLPDALRCSHRNGSSSGLRTDSLGFRLMSPVSGSE